MLIEGKVLELKANFCCNILYVLHKVRTFCNKTNEWPFSTLYRPIVRQQKRAVCCGSCTIVCIRLHIKEGKGAALLVGRSRDRFPVVSLWIFVRVTPDRSVCPEVDTACESEYQVFLLG